MNEHCKTCYHYRPNKRKALKYIFSKIKEKSFDFDTPFVYITLGEAGILDVIDLMEYCYIEDLKKVCSFEKDNEIAKQAQESIVYNVFNNWHRDEKYRDLLDVINDEFPNNIEKNISKEDKKIIFYDITGWFNCDDSDMVYELLKRDVITVGDILIITSTQHPGLGWKPHVQKKVKREYNLCFGEQASSKNEEELRKSVVEIFINRSIRKFNKFNNKINTSGKTINSDLITKVNYKDEGHINMGLWAIEFNAQSNRTLDIPCEFFESYIDNKDEDISVLGGLFDE